jgi:hypothetical protein
MRRRVRHKRMRSCCEAGLKMRYASPGGAKELCHQPFLSPFQGFPLPSGLTPGLRPSYYLAAAPGLFQRAERVSRQKLGRIFRETRFFHRRIDSATSTWT